MLRKNDRFAGRSKGSIFAVGTLLVASACTLERHAAPGAGADEKTAGNEAEGLTIAQAALAKWSAPTTLPIVPVSAASLPDGKILLWSSEDRFSFNTDGGKTYSATFDPATGTSSERLITETGHDMFCPGTANLADGRILVNGGLSNGKTSIFDPALGTWTSGGDMNITRAYEGTAPLQDGSVFTLGGSWSGGVGNKHGEVWTDGVGWRRLPGVTIDPFLSVDSTRNFGMDSHLWLLQAGNGRVFHAGPGFNMNYVDTTGNGKVIPIGRRGDDEFSINGNAVMFDTGKVLKVGGASGYDGIASNANSYVMELGATVTVRKVQPMAYHRAFQNSVVLPNGQVVVIGGATVAVGFSDNNSVLAPEIFDPVTETFTAIAPISVPRNYHSVALLLPDGRVVSAGGGLCGSGCAANHADLQILSPPYLFNADGSAATRPAIVSAPAQAAHGTSMTITTSAPIASFALLRMSSVTHALNNDQRRLSLTFHATGTNAYAVDVPSNPGWAVPGLYMLFALDANGVPSVAKVMRIGSSTPLRLAPVDEQVTTSGAATHLSLAATATGSPALTFGAKGLPPGLAIDPATGTISGAATAEGRYLVSVSVSDGSQTVSTEFTWNVGQPGATRFVLLQAQSEIAGNPWTSAAEVNLLDGDGQPLARGAWTVTADSAELAGENGAPANAIDGNPATLWHTQWQAANPPPPHWLKIDLGGFFQISGLKYLPRQDASANGTIAQFQIFQSADGSSWGTPVAQGSMTPLGGPKDERVVYFTNAARGKTATQSSNYDVNVAARAVDGNTDGNYADGSLSHTNSDANAWWEVDLGASYRTHAVRIYNRTDCCADRLTNFYVLGSNAPMAGRSLTDLLADPTVTSAPYGATAPGVLLLPLVTKGARYVRVELAGTNFLQLAEVEVYGEPAVNRRPALAQPTAPNLLSGQSVALQLVASDPDGDALTFSAVGLPPGLALDAATGIIAGTATTEGSYPVDATVNDGRGGTATAHFNWFVGMPAPVVAPVVAPIAADGTTVSYSASAAGVGSLEYSWSFGDGSADTAFGGSPAVTHTFPGPGVYIVTVTVRDADGGATTRQFLQAIAGPKVAGTPVASSALALETRAGASARLWVANADNDSVSVFDATTLAKVAEIVVGTAPRSVAVAPDGRVWVASKYAATLSVINPATLAVAQTVTLPRGSMPFGVIVAANGSPYVALEGLGRVLKLDASGNVTATLDVGAYPRHLALTAAGDRLLVSRFITPFQPGESTATVLTVANGIKQGGQVVEVDAAAMTVRRTITLQHSDHADSTISGRGVPNYLGAAAISPDGKSAWVPSKQDNVQRGTLRDGNNINFENTVRAISSRIDLGTEAEDYAARVDHDNSSFASAAAYHPTGAYLFVALETSRHVAVVDAYGKRELFRVDAGLSPQAVSVSADGRTLYVLNFMDRAVGVYDLRPLIDRGERSLTLTATLPSVAAEKLTAQVLRGKQLFYDARDTRLSRDSYMSCATCHDDGGFDGRTWDLTGMGEGLRNTIALRGRAGAMGRLHWSENFDEVQDFEGQIRALTQGTGLMADAQFASGTHSQSLGDPKAGLSGDLDALAAYVASLATFEPSPLRPSAAAVTPDAAAGRAVFAVQCASCHSGDGFTDSATNTLHDIGTLKPSSGSRLGGLLPGIDTPTLRDVWRTAPYLHDGSAATVEAAVQAHADVALSATDLANVASFVRQIGGDEPAVAQVGTGLTGQYFTNNALGGAAALKRVEAVNYDWGSGAAGAGLPVDNFSARWSGQVKATAAGAYRFQTVSDDGVRLWVNGALVIDHWNDHSPTTDTSAAITLNQNQRYDVKLEYYEKGGGATMRLNWLPPGQTVYAAIPATQLYAGGTGLRADYFANVGLTGAAALTRYESPSFAWGNGAAGAGLPADNFSARWTGQVLPTVGGAYAFQTNSDDGVRLWVNGVLVVDRWTDHAPTVDTTAAITLLEGVKYAVKLEYYERGGGATMQLSWLPPGATAYAAIPSGQLHGD